MSAASLHDSASMKEFFGPRLLILFGLGVTSALTLASAVAELDETTKYLHKSLTFNPDAFYPSLLSEFTKIP